MIIFNDFNGLFKASHGLDCRLFVNGTVHERDALDNIIFQSGSEIGSNTSDSISERSQSIYGILIRCGLGQCCKSMHFASVVFEEREFETVVVLSTILTVTSENQR